MSPVVDSLIVLASVFASGMLGLFLRRRVPDHYLLEDSVGMVRLCTGVIATLAALVLGLLVASAKANYDRVNDQVTQAAAAIVLLDRTLAQFGTQTQEARGLLRAAVASVADTAFSQQGRGVADLDDPRRLSIGDQLQAQIRVLPADNEVQRTLQAHALDISPIMFAGFGLVTAANRMVVISLFLCALSLAGAVFMIEELNRPLEGVIRVSSAPLRYALEHIGP